jgi:hypothetical protein
MSARRATRGVAEVEAEMVELKQDRRAYARANSGPFAEDLIGNVDRFVADCRLRFDAFTADIIVGGGSPDSQHSQILAVVGYLSSPESHARMRAVAGEMAAGLDGPSKSAVEAELASYDKKLAALEDELKQLRKADEIAELEARYA